MVFNTPCSIIADFVLSSLPPSITHVAALPKHGVPFRLDTSLIPGILDSHTLFPAGLFFFGFVFSLRAVVSSPMGGGRPFFSPSSLCFFFFGEDAFLPYCWPPLRRGNSPLPPLRPLLFFMDVHVRDLSFPPKLFPFFSRSVSFAATPILSEHPPAPSPFFAHS